MAADDCWPSPRCSCRPEQASLHTTASLNKHVGLGAWFAAIAAGYAVDRFIAAAPAGNMRDRHLRGLRARALPSPSRSASAQSWMFATSWPNSSGFIAIFRPLAEHGTGHLLVEDPSIAEYYLPAGSQWQRWSSTRNIVLPSGASTGGPSAKAGVVGAGNAGTFAMYIQQGYFSLIALNFADTTSLDHRPRRGHSPQPSLPHHPGRPLRHRGPGRIGTGHLRDLAIRAAHRERPRRTAVTGTVARAGYRLGQTGRATPPGAAAAPG